MTTFNFSESNGTTLASLGWSATTSNPANDGLTNLSTNGSGFLTNTGAYTYGDGFYNGGGNGASSKGEIVLPSGITPYSATNQRRYEVACRRDTSQGGYSFYLASSTNNAIADTIKLLRNGAFLRDITMSPTIDMSSTGVTMSVQVTNTVDVVAIVNGTTYTSAGSGGNDYGGTAVLTGGYPGLSLYNNGTSGGTIDSWNDGVAAAARASALTLLGVS